jgi:hypothetical protein
MIFRKSKLSVAEKQISIVVERCNSEVRKGTPLKRDAGHEHSPLHLEAPLARCLAGPSATDGLWTLTD